MSGTPIGNLRSAATRIGVDDETYAAKLANGEKWCWRHQTWHPKAEFSPDRYRRGDGLHAVCRVAKREYSRKVYAETKRAARP